MINTIFSNRKPIKMVALAVILFFSVNSATAGMLTLDLNYEISGAQWPQGDAPYLTAVFDDGGTAGSVTLTLSSPGLVASEFVSGWYFNFDPSLSATDLTFSYANVLDTENPDGLFQGSGEKKADGDGWYDIVFSWSNGEFTGGESVVINISGTDITAGSFAFLSTPGGGNGIWLSAAHVQGIDDPSIEGVDTKGSGWIVPNDNFDPNDNGGPDPVPEPASIILFGLGTLGMGALARRRRQSEEPELV